MCACTRRHRTVGRNKGKRLSFTDGKEHAVTFKTAERARLEIRHEGKLTPDERLQVEKLLDQSPAAREQLDDLREAIGFSSFGVLASETATALAKMPQKPVENRDTLSRCRSSAAGRIQRR